jgi:hypothetical protein
MTSERFAGSGLSTGPEPFSDEFSSGTAGEQTVEVIHGVYAHSLPLVGLSVAQARAALEDRMNIDPDAVPVVDGNEADDHTVLAQGQVLNFVKRSGEKGAGHGRHADD